MAAADAGDPSTGLEPPPLSLKLPVWKYFGFPDILTVFALPTKKPPFASSAMCVYHILPLAARQTWQGIAAGTRKTEIYLLNQHL